MKKNKTLIIIIVILLLLCCICSAVTAVVGGSVYFTSRNNQNPSIPLPAITTPAGDDSSNSDGNAIDTPEAETGPSGDNLSGLGVSRSDLISFFNSDGAFGVWCAMA